MLDTMSFFQLIIGGYMLWCAFSGKGNIYDNTRVKKGLEEKYHKTIRIFCFIIGGLMVPGAIADMRQTPEAPNAVLSLISLLTWALSFLSLVVLIVLVVRMGDRTKKPEQPKRSAASAAFEFDEDKTDSSK